MGTRNILRLVLVTGLVSAMAATIVVGTDRYAPDPNDPLYKGSLCRHSPRGS